MVETLSFQTTQNQLGVFVSSRIGECKDERIAAKKAIGSLNHKPILFEHIGARYNSPRTIYLSHLRDAQIMVAIYKDGYGYIDEQNGMEISGLEDEFRYALDNKILTLVYVHKDDTNREDRLKMIIDEAGSQFTLFFYDNIANLGEQIKNDVTAEVTRLVVDAMSVEKIASNQAIQILDYAKNGPIGFIPRPDELRNLQELIENNHSLFVSGESGVGKTTLLARLSEKSNGTYLDLEGRSPKEIFVECAMSISDSKSPLAQYSTIQGAQLGLATVWAETESILLVIDHCSYSDEIIEAITSGGGFSATRRLILSGTRPSNEIAEISISPIEEKKFQKALSSISTTLPIGNVQYPVNLGETVHDIQMRVHKEQVTADIVWYLALLDKPLKIGVLSYALTGSSEQVEKVYEQVNQHKHSILDTSNGLSLTNDEYRNSLINDLRNTPQRLGFYATRLVGALEENSHFRDAYQVSLFLNGEQSLRLARPALREAAIYADWKLGLELAELLIKEATSEENALEAFELSLMLVYPLELLGQISRADEFLEDAISKADELGDNAQRRLKEIQLASRARRTLGRGDIRALEEICEEYSKASDVWNEARLRIEISALYISAKNYENAASNAKLAHQIFSSLEDEYGKQLALRNLASSLSELDGRNSELEETLAKLNSISAPENENARNRAWKCNFLTRRYRRAGRLEDAEKVALEAIELAKVIGDESLHSLNLINLANVYHDQGNSTLAFDTYAQAGVIAQKCGRRDIEADSSRLGAGILNETKADSDLFVDNKNKAAAFAKHSIGLLKDSANIEGLARAYIELAEANADLDLFDDAATAYFNAAQQFANIHDKICEGQALVHGSRLAEEHNETLYLELLYGYLNLEMDYESPLVEPFLNAIEHFILKAPKGALVPVLSLHFGRISRELPTALIPPLVETVISKISNLRGLQDPSRLLLSAMSAAPLLKNDSIGLNRAKLGDAVSKEVHGISYRDLNTQGDLWTLEFNLNSNVLISIECLDSTNESAVAAILISLFLKAFEAEVQDKIVPKSDRREIAIQVATFSEMPDDLQLLISGLMESNNYLDDYGCAVTRTDAFDENIPIFVILGNTFLDNLRLGKKESGMNHYLFGQILYELAYQLTNGEIEVGTLNRAIMEIVRKTL